MEGFTCFIIYLLVQKYKRLVEQPINISVIASTARTLLCRMPGVSGPQTQMHHGSSGGLCKYHCLDPSPSDSDLIGVDVGSWALPILKALQVILMCGSVLSTISVMFLTSICKCGISPKARVLDFFYCFCNKSPQS